MWIRRDSRVLLLLCVLMLFILVFNIVMPLAIRRYIVNRFAKRHTVEESLSRLTVLHQYVQNSVIVISSVVLTVL